MLGKTILLFSLLIFLFLPSYIAIKNQPSELTSVKNEDSYWFVLLRKSNKEYLYRGLAGDTANSQLLKVFNVKSGNLENSPTPLPSLLGRKYWLITKKEPSQENPETAPYFLTLDIPVSDDPPFGPTNYPECDGQCNWGLPGYFGLHGVNGDDSRLSQENSGSSGCIRHADSDIAYLFNLLNPEKEEIRYYIEDI